jgi:hypothetical protein
LTGSSPYERTFQDKNTLVVLYDIAPGTMTEHIDGFFPWNLEQRMVDPSGWILCKAGKTYVGWYPFQEYAWIEEQDTIGQAKNTIGRPEDLLGPQARGSWRLRSHKLQNGYIIEVRSETEVGSFETFCAKLRAHVPRLTLVPGKVAADYVTLNGDRMRFAFPEDRTLNGKKVDLTTYKLFEGPFVNAEVGSQRITLTHSKAKRILDFKTLEVIQQP